MKPAKQKFGWKIVGMTLVPLSVSLVIVGLLVFVVERSPDYWKERLRILEHESRVMFGGRLKFENENEKKLSHELWDLKRREIDDACLNPKKFLPAQNFLLVADKIQESQVYKMIRKMPKGAVLHAHDTAITSLDYVFHNITHRDNLFVCDQDGDLKLQFFATQPNGLDCNWQSLAQLRMVDAKSIDEKLKRYMSMHTQNPDQAYPDGDAAWDKFMSIFIFITPMLTYRPVYEDHFYQGLLELYHDNVQYLELRTTLPTLYELDGTEYGPVEVARIYKKVADKFVKDYPDFVGVKLIYAPLRKCNVSQFDEFLTTAKLLKKELGDFIAGFDLVGQEDKGEPLKDFADKLRTVADDVRVFFHAGETNWYGTSTDENLIDAVLLNAKRIGHGYAAVKHPKILQMIREKDIAIEICPISNQVLSLVRDLRNHPGAMLFSEDYPVVVSNDDPGLWGAKGLSYDFYEAFVGMMSRSADLRALKKLAMNSIKYSSLNEQERIRAMTIWKRKWTHFINKFVNN